VKLPYNPEQATKLRQHPKMSFHHHDTGGRLAPQMASRLAREVRDLILKPESGVCLIVDEATGLPPTLHELTVRLVLIANETFAGSLRYFPYFLPCLFCRPCIFVSYLWSVVS
jgi:hypothetical protein